MPLVLASFYRIQYHRQALELFSGFATDFSKLGSLQERMSPRLREFCLATGCDLGELNRFYQSVEAEIGEMLPK